MLLSKSLLAASSGQDLVNSAALQYPERVIQIGEGRFMRGFADWFIHQLNRQGRFCGRVVVASPRPSGAKHIQTLNEQDGLFTVWLQGVKDGETLDHREVVASVSRGINPHEDWSTFLECATSPAIEFMLSNTTEAGLTYESEPYRPGEYQSSFPAKVTAYLFHRYQHFHGDANRGMTIIPCELVDDNGTVLKQLVLRLATEWGLPTSFNDWVMHANHFCNTLVDRIVTGFPFQDAAESTEVLGYEDALLTVAEPFYLWAIEADDRLRASWSVDGFDTSLFLVDDVGPFRKQKVRILNGAHTAMSGLASLAGIETVGAVMSHEALAPFMERLVFDEIIPAVAGEELTSDELKVFAMAVMDRFRNPFLHHAIASLTLNGISKFRVRVLPTLLDFHRRFSEWPSHLIGSFAAFLLLYRPNDSRPPIPDDPRLVKTFQDMWTTMDGSDDPYDVTELLGLVDAWGADLNQYDGLSVAVRVAVRDILEHGALHSVATMNDGIR